MQMPQVWPFMIVSMMSFDLEAFSVEPLQSMPTQIRALMNNLPELQAHVSVSVLLAIPTRMSRSDRVLSVN